MNSSNFIIIILLTFFLFLSSCTENSGNKESGNLDLEREQEIDEETNIDGIYMAKFETLNPHVNGTLPGSLTFYRNGDRLLTFVRLFAGKPRAWHQQGIYYGNRCPSLEDDLNNDGFIDIEEGMKVFGKMVIPLDANINSQMAGRNLFPRADLSGYYHYERVASFSRLFFDLRSEDLDQEDHIMKLDSFQKWTFNNKVVVVQGVDEKTFLPDSVAGQGKRRPFQALPITCGIIKKVDLIPGLPDSGEIPGPVAEVYEDQDRPGPPVRPEDDDNSNTGESNTNETDEGDVSEGE